MTRCVPLELGSNGATEPAPRDVGVAIKQRLDGLPAAIVIGPSLPDGGAVGWVATTAIAVAHTTTGWPSPA